MTQTATYHSGRAQWWLEWLLAKRTGLDEDEKALGEAAVRAHVAMAEALRARKKA